MSLEVIFFRKKNKFYLMLPFFVFLLPVFIIERSHNTLSVFAEGAMEQILRAKVWLYGFESIFWKNLTDFFVVYLLFFL